ncbi:MAG: hypothetical protein M3N98_11245, partial [Actinomycetota bacterium]|nr:hypothetical protein [Actinomycetota bacterium]
MFEPVGVDFEALVASEAAGEATPAESARLEACRHAWVATLRRLTIETDDALHRAERITGPERDQVVADLCDERSRMIATLRRVADEDPPFDWDESEEDEAGGTGAEVIAPGRDRPQPGPQA